MTAKAYSKSTPNLDSWKSALDTQSYKKLNVATEHAELVTQDDTNISEDEVMDSAADAVDEEDDDDFCSLSGSLNSRDLYITF